MIFGILIILISALAVFFLKASGHSNLSEKGALFENEKLNKNREEYHSGTERKIDLNKKIDGPRFLDDNVDPAKAQQLLRNAGSKFPDITDRAIYTCGIIRALCQSGYSEEAWLLLESNPGMLRNGQLTQFFRSAQLSESRLLELIKQVPHDSSSTVAGYISRFSISELPDVVNSGKLQETLGEALNKKDVMAGVIASSFREIGVKNSSYESNVLAMEKLVKLHSAGFLDDNAIYNIVDRPDVGSVFDGWSILDGVKFRAVDKNNKVRSNMISKMVDQDALRAVDMMRGNSRDGRNDDLYKAIQNWVRIDSSMMLEWYNSTSKSLSNMDADAVATANISLAFKSDELDSASSWINLIRDPELKIVYRKKIEEIRERKTQK